MELHNSHISRRRFIQGAGGASAAAIFLAACGGSSSSTTGSKGGGNEALKFWDMPWGGADFNKIEGQITNAYKPAKGLPKAELQVIQWTNFTSTFGAAVASGTGPAVSSGGGFQAFLYATEGKIAYADNLISKFKSSGLYDDFEPGLIDLFKTPKGYVAVPWLLDIRVWLYNKPVFAKLGITPPTTWDGIVETARKLKKAGYTGVGFNCGAGSVNGYQQLLTLMINNGGGLFNANGDVDCVTQANIEAMEWVTQLQKEGLLSPNAVSYTDSDAITQWQKNNFVMGVSDPGYNLDASDKNIGVFAEPVSSVSGHTATLVYVDNLMMYTESPSQQGSEDFLEYYLPKVGAYWQKGLMDGLPALKSIANSAEYKAQTNLYTASKNWLPVAQSFATKATQLSAKLGTIDGGPQLIQFAQRIMSGQDAKSSLQTLQTQLQSVTAS
jgi:multiple sugar transport system substrate-binding protein